MSALSTYAILRGMADALPTHPKGDESSDLASSYEAVALLIHAYLAAIDFKLVGFDEDKSIRKASPLLRCCSPLKYKLRVTNVLLPLTVAECESLAPRLPPQWNSGFGSLAFVYKHKQSTMRFVFRIDRMGTKVEIRGLAVGDDKIHRFECATRNMIDSSELPVRITLGAEGQEDRGDLVDKLRKVFVSEQGISDILLDLKVNIVQKLIPKLQKEGYVEIAEAEANADAERRSQEARDRNNPYRGDAFPNAPYPPRGLLPEMARPRPPHADIPLPGFDDEYDINRSRRGPMMPGRSPYNIGHDDLNPPNLGQLDPLGGVFAGRGWPRVGSGSGMHPSLDDPLFTGQGGFGNDGGHPAYDPQLPPGARWDPTGPAGMPRYPGPGAGRGHNPFDGFNGSDFM